jgi:hypothetical protein
MRSEETVAVRGQSKASSQWSRLKWAVGFNAEGTEDTEKRVIVTAVSA